MSWEKRKFADLVFNLQNGGTPSTKKPDFWDGNIPWITGADFANQKVAVIRRHITEKAIQSSSTNVVEKGDFLLVTRTGVGKMAIAPFDVAISQDITGITFNPDISPEFMLFKLEHEISYFLRLNQGTSINGITRNDLLDFDLELPTSKSEQTRIAEILSKADAGIAETERLIAKYTRIKTGLMQDLLTRGVDENGNIRSRATHKFVVKNGIEVPEDWDVCELIDVVPKAEYGISVSLDDDSGIPVLRMNNLKDGEVDLSNLKYSDSAEARRILLKDSDILFNRTNSIEHVGRTAIWRGQIQEASFASYLVRLVPDITKLLPEYLNFWLNQAKIQSEMRIFATIGVHQVNINPTNLRKLYISLPKNLEEQQKIIDLINFQRQSIENVKASLTKLQAIKTGLMQDLLSGKKRVA